MASKKELTFKEHVKVIRYAKKFPRVGTQEIAQHFYGDWTQIQNILQKEEIMSAFECHAPASRKHIRRPAFVDVDDIGYWWYSFARKRNVPVSGPILQQEALLLARRLGDQKFKASNRWLDCFKKRNNIENLVISGESANVPEETVEAWTERLHTLLEGYSPENIWIEEEQGAFLSFAYNISG